MLQGGGDPDLTQEALGAHAHRKGWVQHFERYRAPVAEVAGQYTLAILPRPSSRSMGYRSANAARRRSIGSVTGLVSPWTGLSAASP
jgi:hypothetical protein